MSRRSDSTSTGNPLCRALLLRGVLAAALVALWQLAAASESDQRPALAPLPQPASASNAEQVELGKRLFFDGRLSGDSTTSCATCHVPDLAWTDGLPLSKGYPGTLYFRNTPTLANVAQARYVYWDGRLPADDLPTVVRDHIAEAQFMQADGRLVIERLRQVPEYEAAFHKAFGGEPTYGRILAALSGFVSTIRSRDVPLDRYLAGDEDAISDQAKQGLALFRGKAGCIRCHHGPMLTDDDFHNLGLPPNPQIVGTPERHISLRRFMRTLGLSDYASLRDDVGLYCVTKRPDDRRRFRTPSLREVERTAPYMHDGSLATLEDVVAFYNQGGGDAAGKDALLEPLQLSADEQRALVAFLKTLSGTLPEVEPVEPPPYQLRKLGEN